MKRDDTAIQIQGLTVCYDEHPILWNLDLGIPKGVMVAVVGPNGAGKSTLLKASLQLTPAIGGSIQFLGQPLEKVRKKVAYVPQRESVDWNFPIDVYQLVMMGRYAHLGWLKSPSCVDESIVEKVLDLVGMTAYRHRQINQLSGGQQQRAFLARALAQQAAVYLMDEPFAAVDQTTEKQLARIMKELTQEGVTAFVVHHDLQTLREYFDWVVLLNGRIIASGPVEEVCRPELLEETYGRVIPTLRDI